VDACYDGWSEKSRSVRSGWENPSNNRSHAMMAAPRIVRYDSALCAAPVFQPVWRGERPKLNLKFNFDGVVWRWRGPEQLGIGEQMSVSTEGDGSGGESLQIA
jgi:hypothetical protein